jgi:hypothetical protein
VKPHGPSLPDGGRAVRNHMSGGVGGRREYRIKRDCDCGMLFHVGQAGQAGRCYCHNGFSRPTPPVDTWARWAADTGLRGEVNRLEHPQYFFPS